MNKSMLEAYQERWRSVAKFEAEEQRQLSFAQRWQKLNSLIRMAAGLGILYKDNDPQIESVRARWNLLRDLYIADMQGPTE